MSLPDEYESIRLIDLKGFSPGAKVMTMKVVFEKDTWKLLGAQIVGTEGVDKRLDVIATAMHAGMKANMLKDLDLAYAPPFSSAKDPVNMAGFMIENIRNGFVKQYHWDEIAGLPRDGSVTLLDTRTAYEYKSGHIVVLSALFSPIIVTKIKETR